MSKKIESPVVRFPGSVTLKDPIPLSVCVEWETAMAECQPSPCSTGREILTQFWRTPEKDREVVSVEYSKHFTECVESGGKCRIGLSDTAAQVRLLPAIKACVESWEVPSFDLSNPPGSPKAARSKFIGWLVQEISLIYNEAEGDPNE